MDRPRSGLTPEQRGNHDDGCDALKGSLSGSQSHAAAPRASAQRSTSFWHRPERARDRRAREIRPVASGVANGSDGRCERALAFLDRMLRSRCDAQRSRVTRDVGIIKSVQHPEFCLSIKSVEKRSADPNVGTARARPVYRNGAWPEFRAPIRARARAREPSRNERLRGAIRARARRERENRFNALRNRFIHFENNTHARARRCRIGSTRRAI